MGISLKIKIPIGSRRRPSKTSAGQNPPGEGSNRKQAQDYSSGGPPSPQHSQKPESRPKPYVVQPRRPSYNTVIVRPGTVPQKTHVTTHTIATTTPSSHRHRRRSSASIRSPHRTSHSYAETSTRHSPARRHRRRSSQTPRSPVSPLGTSRFEFPSPYARPQPAVQRDEYGFSIRTPSTPAGQANAYGMSALAPANSDEWSYFEPRVGGTWKKEGEKGKSGWTEEDLRGYCSYGVGRVGAVGGGSWRAGSGQSGRERRGEGRNVRFV